MGNPSLSDIRCGRDRDVRNVRYDESEDLSCWVDISPHERECVHGRRHILLITRRELGLLHGGRPADNESAQGVMVGVTFRC
jgi:hypothetical protein